MRRLLRIAMWTTYPFLVLSVLLFFGMMFGATFVTGFTIENRSGQFISVTPIGCVGPSGERAALPIVMFSFVPLPALRAGGFPLADGETVTIRYDMDDINFSEIVVEDGRGQQFQLVTDPTPTANQYHSPQQRLFVIGRLKDLDPVAPEVAVAAKRAQGWHRGSILLNAILFAPWLFYVGLRWTLYRVVIGNTAKGVSTGAHPPD